MLRNEREGSREVTFDNFSRVYSVCCQHKNNIAINRYLSSSIVIQKWKSWRNQHIKKKLKKNRTEKW